MMAVFLIKTLLVDIRLAVMVRQEVTVAGRPSGTLATAGAGQCRGQERMC